MNVHKGFTLVEMLATIAVATVLLGIATPSFVQMSRRNRLLTYSNDLVATINFARSEAIRRGSTVTICHSNDAATCSGTWSDGWIVFADPDGDGARDTSDANEVLLRTQEPLAHSYTLAGSAVFADHIIYNADGAAQGTGVFAICHDDETNGARAVIVTRLRPRSAQDTDNNGIPNTDVGDLGSCTEP